MIYGGSAECARSYWPRKHFSGFPHAALGQVLQTHPNGKIKIRIVFFGPENPRKHIFSPKNEKKISKKIQKGTYPLWSENSNFCFARNFFSKKAIRLH